jgi:hypothetical protein
MTRSASLGLLLALSAGALTAQSSGSDRLSADGVVRAGAMVDSVFLDRTRLEGHVAPGDWASYMLARLGAGPIPDSLGIVVAIDSAHIEVRGRLQDLPAESRALLGPLANAVDPSSVIVADILYQRTGKQVARFWLRGLIVNGFPFPEFLLVPMMARVGRQYPELTKSGRDLYVQIPADAAITLVNSAVLLTASPRAVGTGTPPQQ